MEVISGTRPFDTFAELSDSSCLQVTNLGLETDSLRPYSRIEHIMTCIISFLKEQDFVDRKDVTAALSPVGNQRGEDGAIGPFFSLLWSIETSN